MSLNLLQKHLMCAEEDESMSEYLSYNEYKTSQRLNRYVQRLGPVYQPHAHAVRASKGLKIQARLRGLGTKARALWAAASGGSATRY